MFFHRPRSSFLAATCRQLYAIVCSDDPPGFVQILDDETLLIPDRPGNYHLDSIENIVANPNVGLIFFVPGSEETLRVNGRARVVTIRAFSPPLNSMASAESRHRSSIREVFLHCPKALKRSRLWDPSQHANRASLPYLGRLIFEQTRQFATPEFGAGEPLEKAKELCRRDGKAWSLDDFEGGVSGVTMLTVVADDNDRKAYTYRGRGAAPGTAFQRRLPWQHFSKVFAYRALTEKRFHRQF